MAKPQLDTPISLGNAAESKNDSTLQLRLWGFPRGCLLFCPKNSLWWDEGNEFLQK
jgi:hypothetical protein